MNNAECTEVDSDALPSARTKSRTNRCYQCNGRFGLIRCRLALKQFCSERCLNKYKTNMEIKMSRIKKWAEFLTRRL